MASHRTPRPVPRGARLLDALGLLCIAGGAAGYGWSWLRMRELQRGMGTPSTETLLAMAAGRTEAFAAVARWERYQSVSFVSLGLVALGLALAVVAALVARRRPSS